MIEGGVPLLFKSGAKIPEDVLVHYTMDNVSTNTLIDEAGNYNATINGASPASGYIDNSLRFDGTNDWVSLGTALNAVSPLTGIGISVWTYLDDATNAVFVMGHRTNSGAATETRRLVLAADPPNGWLYFDFQQTTTGRIFLEEFPFVYGDWVHLAASYDGSIMRLWYDGVEVGTTTVADLTCIFDEEVNVLGRVKTGTSIFRYVPSRCDQLRVYDRGLTTAELSTLAAETAPAPPDQGDIPLDYVAYYTMTNVSGSTLIDEAGNYDMSITGAVVSGGYMVFDGVDDYCESTAIPALSGDCAVCCWVIPDVVPDNVATKYPFQQRQSIGFAHDHPSSTVSGTSLRYNNTPAFEITSPNQNITDTVNPTCIMTIVEGGFLYSYQNGTLIGSTSAGTYSGSGLRFNIGCGQTNEGTTRISFFPGKIKAFRVYNRALTAAEISAIASEF